MDPDVERGLRREIKAFVTEAGRRRALPVTVYVGRPGSERLRLPDAQEQRLRTDLLARALDGLLEPDRALVWLTRGGSAQTTAADREWHAVAHRAFARHGLDLPACVVLTRAAWVDLVSGEQHTWTRIRARRQQAVHEAR